MSDIRVQNLVKTFGATTAVDRLDLEIQKGEMVALLGPSGCGKTTLLRMIAGFETPDSGSIRLNGTVINDLPPQKRKIGVVFQDYAIFPTMSVFDNIAYGLKIKKLSKEEIYKDVMEYLGLVGLVGYEKRMPSQLSGGQQQRVALARALITKPEVLLLDEPLSNLDAALRLRIRKEIRKLQQALGITAIFVTHDQEEALSIADKIFVMRHGELMQGGSPADIYSAPANDFVADFIGKSNILYGKVTCKRTDTLTVSGKGVTFDAAAAGLQDVAINQDVWISIRPHLVRLEPGRENGSGGDSISPGTMNTGTGTVTYVEYLGNYTKGELRLQDGFDLEFEHYHFDPAARDNTISRGDRVAYGIAKENILVGTNIRGIE
ncbi:MAG TPA: ABC transporter ATP-binding protein [bacterium]|nr:ABC transporter ATP-binding protein [bacterium]